jgi:hypothetical protein
MMRFLLRLLGLAGLFVAGIGVLGLFAMPAGDRGTVFAVWLGVAIVGGVIALAMLVVELVAGVQQSAGRRSAAGTMVLLQVALAVVLLIGINIFSIFHYERWDATEKKEFSRTQSQQLGPQLAEQLKQLRGETTVVIYQQHKTFGRFSDKPADSYDAAADRKVVDKIKDLVQELRQYGTRFRVVTLDVKEEDFDSKLADEAQRFPGLKEAVNAAPENSIFFCTPEHIQRLGFSEYYQLDKTASQQADNGRGNLVLLDQGVEPFLRRVLAIEEKKPRIGVAVGHPWLGSEGPWDEVSLAGMKKSLTDNGFEVRDIILKKLVGRRGRQRPEPAAMTNNESKADRLDVMVQALRRQMIQDRLQIEQADQIVAVLKSNRSPEEVTRELNKLGQRLPRDLTSEERQDSISHLEPILSDLKQELARKEEKEKSLTKELEQLQSEERVMEGQHQPDVKHKLEGLLDDCDLLIVPRITLLDTANDMMVPNWAHQLDEAQVAAIKDYLKKGKPVLFCFGPINEPGDPRDPTGRKSTPTPDALENLVSQLGLHFTPQTVLYDAESDAYAQSQVMSFGRGGSEDIPPLLFTDESGAVRTLNPSAKPLSQNPIAESMKLTSRSAGQKLELKMRYPRPVMYQSLRAPAAFESAFLFTPPSTWNDDDPFPTEDRIPRYEKTKPDDPARGTRLEHRRGPFVVGLAVETLTPIEWYDERYEAAKAAQFALAGINNTGGLPMGVAIESFQPPELWAPVTGNADSEKAPHRVRIAAVGQANWVAGAKLSPANETLLVDTCNWLLMRDDRLPKAKETWRYPRVELSQRDQGLWRWSMFLGLPWTITCVGLVVLMVRRMR